MSEKLVLMPLKCHKFLNSLILVQAACCTSKQHEQSSRRLILFQQYLSFYKSHFGFGWLSRTYTIFLSIHVVTLHIEVVSLFAQCRSILRSPRPSIHLPLIQRWPNINVTSAHKLFILG